ncbi:MAG TPA: hypothetical protein VG518_03310 [Solirubrobacterales bacterium]|nr:hypothetical protein [Solirubrobacterales bacterium]
MEAGATEAGSVARPQASRRVLILLAEEVAGDKLVEELARQLGGEGVEAIVVAPAVEKTLFQHALGDVDGAVREARGRLERSLSELRRGGIKALGEVGDADPLVAAEDCLRRYPVGEVWVVAHVEDQARWFEDGLFEKAQEQLRAPVRIVTVRREEATGALRPVEIERAGSSPRPDAGEPATSHPPTNIPPLSRRDMAGAVVGIIGTIAAIVLAAAGPGPSSAAGSAAILVAMATALVNMAHVVGLVLIESVDYHGGWQRFFRGLSGFGTPLAVLANLLILLLD